MPVAVAVNLHLGTTDVGGLDWRMGSDSSCTLNVSMVMTLCLSVPSESIALTITHSLYNTREW